MLSMGHYRNCLLGRQFASLITRNVCFLAFHLAVNKLPYILKHNIFSFCHTHTSSHCKITARYGFDGSAIKMKDAGGC